MADTLFDKYGGFSTFQEITRDFYVKVLDCDHLRHYFNGVSMDAIIDHQARFLSRSLGGPEDKYADVDLIKVQAHLDITEEDFSEVVELLTESLEDSGVEPDDITAIMLLVVSLKDQIVSA
jgi:truncated hemoglobin YjbI